MQGLNLMDSEALFEGLDDVISHLNSLNPDLDIRFIYKSEELLILRELLNISKELKLKPAEMEIQQMIEDKQIETFGYIRKNILKDNTSEIRILTGDSNTKINFEDYLEKMLGIKPIGD